MTPQRKSGTGSDAVRSELAETYRRIARMRHASVAVIAVAALLIGGSLWLGGDIRSDPTDRAMQELVLPDWSHGESVEEVEGSRWCWESCRVRVRTWQAGNDLHDVKDQVRQRAVQHDWRKSATVECDADSLCLIRDDLVLHLRVRSASCDEATGECASTVASLLITSQASWPRINS